MDTLGRHLLAELHGCDATLIDDEPTVSAALHQAAAAVGATVVAHAIHHYAPQGVSAILLIAESHISVHTWPEARYVAVDIYTCGGLDPNPGAKALAAAFEAGRTIVKELSRGSPDGILGIVQPR